MCKCDKCQLQLLRSINYVTCHTREPEAETLFHWVRCANLYTNRIVIIHSIYHRKTAFSKLSFSVWNQTCAYCALQEGSCLRWQYRPYKQAGTLPFPLTFYLLSLCPYFCISPAQTQSEMPNITSKNGHEDTWRTIYENLCKFYGNTVSSSAVLMQPLKGLN